MLQRCCTNRSGKLTSGTSVDVLTSVHAFDSDHHGLDETGLEGVAEGDLGEGSTASRVVDDFLNETTDVAFAFVSIQSTEL